jgi:Family of unknown function (DUF5989)
MISSAMKGCFSHRKVEITMSKIAIASEFWQFLRVRKKYWLLPIVLMLLALGVLMILTEGSVLAPFIYALF